MMDWQECLVLFVVKVLAMLTLCFLGWLGMVAWETLAR